MKKLSLVALFGSLVVAAACQQDPALDQAQAISAGPTPSLPAPSTLNLFYMTGTPPATPAGTALQWTLEQLNLEPPSDETITANFDPTVLEGTSATDIADHIERVGRNRPFAFVGFVSEPTPTRMEALMMSSREGYQKLTIETNDTGLLKVLLFERITVPLADDNPTSPEGWSPEPAAAPPTPAAPTPAPDSGVGAAPAAAGSGEPAAAGSGEPAAAAPTE